MPAQNENYYQGDRNGRSYPIRKDEKESVNEQGKGDPCGRPGSQTRTGSFSAGIDLSYCVF